MKLTIAKVAGCTLAILALSVAASAQKYVPGHTTKSGKYVAGHYTKPRQSKGSSKLPTTTKSRKSRPLQGAIILASSDSRIMVGDRVTSILDSKGKSHPIKSSSDIRAAGLSGDVTIRLSRDGKRHSFKYKSFPTGLSF